MWISKQTINFFERLFSSNNNIAYNGKEEINTLFFIIQLQTVETLTLRTVSLFYLDFDSFCYELSAVSSPILV